MLDVRTNEPVAMLHGHKGGITHARFSACGNYLYTAARRDDAIQCWDARTLSGSAAVYSLSRGGSGDTNQRMAFDIEPGGRHLSIGGTDGRVRCFDLQTAAQVSSWKASTQSVAGFAYHPAGLPLAVTGSGCRTFPEQEEDGDDSPAPQPVTDNALRLWRWGTAPL
jgi:WD40 repeat protein